MFGSPKSTPAIEINVCWQIRARSIGQQCFISLLERRQFDKLVYRVEYSEPLFSSVRQECSLSNGRGCLLPACVASLVLFFGSFYSARLSRSSVGGVQFTVPHHCTRNSSQLFSLLFSFVPSSLLFLIGHFFLQVPAEDHGLWCSLHSDIARPSSALDAEAFNSFSFSLFFPFLHSVYSGIIPHLIYYGGILGSVWRRIGTLSHVVLCGTVLRLR